jgi:flagellar basal-body rod protein FlgB
MDYNQIGLFNLADRRLDWVNKRQEVLAQNVANADTPGWKSRDLTPFAAQLAQGGVTPAGVSLAQTNPMHLPGDTGGTGGTVSHATTNGETAPDGNAVSLDVELARIADTETTHDLVDDLYTKYLGMFRTAIDR